MVSTYSSAVVRTTHLSGMFTDLGIFLGHAIRSLQVNWLRLRLCFLIISAFFCGGVVGALAFRRFGCSTLFIPGGLTAITSIAYGLYGIRKSRNA